MKKLVSLILALALCLGLAAPALAVEHTVTAWNDDTIIIDAISVEDTTLMINTLEAEPVAFPEEVKLVTVAPGTTISIKTADGASSDTGATIYEPASNGAYDMSSQFGVSDGDALEPVDGLIRIGQDTYITFATEDTTTSTTPTTTPVEGGVVYTVKQYDTMGKIALNYYGSYGYHLELYKANSEAFAKTGGNFNTGMTLTLPDTLAGKTRLAEPTLAEGESFYTVKAGDTLGAIAAATYGDIMMYEEIYERNADRLKNANTIFEGQVIVLPAK